MNGFSTAFKWLIRALVKGDWLWLWLAVLMASMTVTMVTQLANTVEKSLLRQAAETLGADAVIRSSRPIDQKWVVAAKAEGFETSSLISTVTMAYEEGMDDFQLVRLKAVDAAYPLRGREAGGVKIAPQQTLISQKLYERYQALSDAPLKTLSLALGVIQFDVQGQFRPKGMEGMNSFAPEVRIRLNDLEQAQLLGAGSRASYELSILSEDSEKLKQWLKTLKAEKNPAWQIISAEAPNADLQNAMQTAKLFLELAALSAVLVAGLAILIASRFYLSSWQSSIALMRAYGASKNRIRQIFAWQLTLLGVMASLLGATVGAIVFYLLIPTLSDYFETLVVSSFVQPIVLGILSGALVLWGFAWQAYRQVVNIAPIQILRKVTQTQTWQNWVGFVFLLVLVVVMVGSENLIWVLSGLILISAAFILVSWLILQGLKRVQTHTKGWLKLGLSVLLKSPSYLQMQLVSFGMVLFVLMLMTFVRQDLLMQWQTSFTEDTPNAFLMNIQPDQREATQQILNRYGIESNLVAMARGRLIAKNGQTLEPEDQIAPRARRLLQREANVALMDEVSAHNLVLQGQTQVINGVSVEKGMADLFDLKMGDQLTFDFIGEKITLPVVSIREVVWQSFELNFFFVIPTEFQSRIAYTYIGNFHLTVEMQGLNRALNQSVSGVFMVDVREIMAQVQTMMDQSSYAVTALYLFTMISSLIVLLTATYATQQGRLQTWILLRTVGASRGTMLKMGMSEFALLGAGAGLVAATFAQIVSVLLSLFVFEMPWQIQLDMWFVTLLVGSLSLLLIGWLTQFQFLNMDYAQMRKHAR